VISSYLEDTSASLRNYWLQVYISYYRRIILHHLILKMFELLQFNY